MSMLTLILLDRFSLYWVENDKLTLQKRGPYRRFIGPRIGGIFRRKRATAFWQNAEKCAVEMLHLGVLQNA